MVGGTAVILIDTMSRSIAEEVEGSRIALEEEEEERRKKKKTVPLAAAAQRSRVQKGFLC